MSFVIVTVLNKSGQSSALRVPEGSDLLTVFEQLRERGDLVAVEIEGPRAEVPKVSRPRPKSPPLAARGPVFVSPGTGPQRAPVEDGDE